MGYATETTEAAAEDLQRTYYPALEREEEEMARWVRGGGGEEGNVSRRSIGILRSANKIIRKKDVTWFPRCLFWAII